MALRMAAIKYDDRRGIALLAVGLFVAHQLLEGLLALLYHHRFLDTCHWDCKWYAGIVQGGYSLSATALNHQTNWAFFPLFPALVFLVSAATTMAAPLAAVLLGKLLFLFSIYAFIAFCEKYGEGILPLHAGMVAALSPYALYGDAGYTEPLFLLLTCAFFIALKDRRYVVCGLMGALLSATRVPGMLVALPYAIVVAAQFQLASRERKWEMLLGGLLIPFGLAVYMLHLYGLTGDALAFFHVQKAWHRPLGNPFSVVAEGFDKGAVHYVWAAMSVLALAVSVYLMATRRVTLGIFSFCCTLIPLLSGLKSMPRYIWWQVPILLVLAGAFGNRTARLILLPLFVAGLAYMFVAWMAVKAWAV